MAEMQRIFVTKKREKKREIFERQSGKNQREEKHPPYVSTLKAGEQLITTIFKKEISLSITSERNAIKTASHIISFRNNFSSILFTLDGQTDTNVD